MNLILRSKSDQKYQKKWLKLKKSRKTHVSVKRDLKVNSQVKHPQLVPADGSFVIFDSVSLFTAKRLSIK